MSVMVMLGVITSSEAAERSFGPFHYDDAAPELIILDGPLDSGTALDFRRVLAAAPAATILALNSTGGSVSMGLLIADDVDRRHIATFIPKEAGCYSACSYIFFAGAQRVAIGELGVHQLSADSPDLVSAQLAISDIIDVLSRFGVPPQVMTVMFRTPPDKIHVFTPEEVTSLGINRGSLPSITRTADALPQSDGRDGSDGAQATTVSLDDRARRFLDDLLYAWSGPNAAAMRAMDLAYGREVEFYGKQVSHDAVIEDKRRFAERWPNRSYHAEPDSVSVRCANTICAIDAIVDWSAASAARGKNASGAARLSIIWDAGADQIVGETGRVLKTRRD